MESLRCRALQYIPRRAYQSFSTARKKKNSARERLRVCVSLFLSTRAHTRYPKAARARAHSAVYRARASEAHKYFFQIDFSPVFSAAITERVGVCARVSVVYNSSSYNYFPANCDARTCKVIWCREALFFAPKLTRTRAR